MSKVGLSAVTAALEQAGIEVYRVVDAEIQVAERVRLHIMDSGVRVEVANDLAVVFRARSQRSDHPHRSSEELVELVRTTIGPHAAARGFGERDTASRDLLEPANPGNILDVWHEITYAKTCSDVSSLIDDVRWALALDKYVAE